MQHCRIGEVQSYFCYNPLEGAELLTLPTQGKVIDSKTEALGKCPFRAGAPVSSSWAGKASCMTPDHQLSWQAGISSLQLLAQNLFL